MTGPKFPLSNQASSAAHFAPRQVEAALYDAIVASAMKISTSVRGYFFFVLKGEGMLSNAKIV